MWAGHVDFGLSIHVILTFAVEFWGWISVIVNSPFEYDVILNVRLRSRGALFILSVHEHDHLGS